MAYDEEKKTQTDVGEICVYSPSAMKGYFRSDADGVYIEYDGKKYIRTGDIGYVKNNALYFCGRKKNVIIKSGEKILPSWIENAATEARGVSAAVAFGVHSDNYGEEIYLAVEKKSEFDYNTLTEHLAKRLPKHLLPSYIKTYESFTLNNSGKTDIAELKNTANEYSKQL